MALQSFNVTFIDGKGAWDVQASMSEIKEAAMDGKDTEAKVWEHQTLTIKKPSSDPSPATFDIASAARAYFDGGCRDKQGSGGYLIFAPDGSLLAAQAIYYGNAAPTNNVAECKALVDCLDAVSKLDLPTSCPGVLVNGDSKLAIAFM